MNPAPVFRFAPSPNGHLHLGHAYSALLNQKLARDNNGVFLLRVENIDTNRCTPELEKQMLLDLEWLGIEWDEAPIRQSDRFEIYKDTLSRLRDDGLLYPAFMSRKQQERWIASRHDKHEMWPTDPDGAPHYPPEDKHLSADAIKERIANGIPFAERLNMPKTILKMGKEMNWKEFDARKIETSKPVSGYLESWGDVVLRRKDTPTSYHLACVVDDALQGITHVVRGMDLYHSTSVHRLLQQLFGLPEPLYHHHSLIQSEGGLKLSKSRKDTALRDLRHQEISAQDIHEWLGFH